MYTLSISTMKLSTQLIVSAVSSETITKEINIFQNITYIYIRRV